MSGPVLWFIFLCFSKLLPLFWQSSVQHPLERWHGKLVFKKVAAFVFKYQAVTSESGSKVRLFSPFPQMLVIDISRALFVSDASKTKTLYAVCASIKFANLLFSRASVTYALLLNQLDTRVSFLQMELAAAKEEKATPMEVVNSFHVQWREILNSPTTKGVPLVL